MTDASGAGVYGNSLAIAFQRKEQGIEMSVSRMEVFTCQVNVGSLLSNYETEKKKTNEQGVISIRHIIIFMIQIWTNAYLDNIRLSVC